MEAYRAIVRITTGRACKIWLFGLSRGAYTVRSVAGMINNLGVLRDWADENQLLALCEEVYSIYRNRDVAYKPDSDFAQGFREAKSWPRPVHGRPPIRWEFLPMGMKPSRH